MGRRILISFHLHISAVVVVERRVLIVGVLLRGVNFSSLWCVGEVGGWHGNTTKEGLGLVAQNPLR
jgi:hypothetical protein